ncbi:hypothetical protein FHS57_006343 [Runella defluvii]|uniref:Tc toxin complex TcA C-terminal TcB-binding domain-containing protein n=1 Tax=Runella defluvii TaxID=370973 RepID=A0A7W6EU80_9BACT|nr:neuraminidase-like domain-containing protein [Runella defluvii]MBB3842312.1 hypothetical protein [Runella defluvii]
MANKNEAFNKEVGYMTLFPNTEFNNVTEAYSTFGAGAYFQYLMEKAKPLTPANEDFSLLKRRPDLATLTLTQDNCDQDVPYLSIVNDRLNSLNKKYEYGHYINRHSNLEKLNVCLKTFGSSLSEFVSLFGDESTLAQGEFCAFIGLESTYNDKLSPKELCQIANIDQDKLYQLIYNGLDENDDVELLKLYINKDSTKPQKLSKEDGKLVFIQQSDVQKNQLYRFLDLAYMTSWSFEDLYAVLAYLNNPSLDYESDYHSSFRAVGQLNYLSRKWGMQPKNLVESIRSGNLIEIAAKLSVSPLFLDIQGLEGEVVLFKAQKNKELLETLQVSLTDYWSTLLTAKLKIEDGKLISFLIDLNKKLNDTKAKYTLPTEVTEIDAILLKQWIEEFAAFAGLHSVDLINLINGLEDKKMTKDLLDDDLLYVTHDKTKEKKLKTQKKIKEGAKYIAVSDFFHAIIPYALLVDKLQIDDAGIEYLAKYILPKDGNGNLEVMTDEIAENVLQFATIYNPLTTALKSDFRMEWVNTSQTKNNNGLIVFNEKLLNVFELPKEVLENGKEFQNNKFATESFGYISRLLQIERLAKKINLTYLELQDIFLTTVRRDGGYSDWFTKLKQEKKTPIFSTFRQHWGTLLERERDTLTGHHLCNIAKQYEGIDTVDHLSDYLLIDVEMSGKMDITPLREATDAVQTFLMRCKNGLEKLDEAGKAALAAITPNEWLCLSSFRIWQAEEILKVFPENYLQAEARSTATDLFKKTIDALRSNELTKEDAKNAVLNYLDEWVDLMNTPIVEVEKCITYSPHFDGKRVITTFLISKSVTKENSFYFCYQDNNEDKIHWTQWKEIPVQINAKEGIKAYYCWNRWHIFWNEFSSITETDDNNKKIKKYAVSVKYIYQNIDDSWSSTKTLTNITNSTEEFMEHWSWVIPNKGSDSQVEKRRIYNWNTSDRIDTQLYLSLGAIKEYFSYDCKIGSDLKICWENKINTPINEGACTKYLPTNYIADTLKDTMMGLRFEGHANGLAVMEKTPSNTITDDDVKASFNLYYRELFFHLPMAVAELFVHDLQFDEAKKWYHYVFNPIGINEEKKEDVWKFSPFKKYSSGKKIDYSFDPDILATADFSIYKRWTVMRYINCMIEQGDNEFRKSTWEGLSAALQCYFEAEDLLGQEPVVKDRMAELTKDNHSRTYDKAKFEIPTNPKPQELWTRLQDRLYKLRNGFNINGERQMPSTYGTAIDPARLLVAAQNGGINPYNTSNLTQNRPHYRFRDLMPHTESIIHTVVEFGGQLYNALNQKDHEQLQILQATHQVNMQNLIEQTYLYHIEEAEKELQNMQKNKDSMTLQQQHYDDLITKGNLIQENQALFGLAEAQLAQKFAAVTRYAAAFSHLLPNIFGLADGGMQFGSAIESMATTYSELAQVEQTGVQMLQITAEHTRREQEWNFQKDLIAKNLEQVEVSIETAKIRLKLAQEGYKQYQLQSKQANEVLTYLNNKFTNVELYTWMSQQMSSLYFSAYNLALSALHSLQEAYQYELDEKDNFIPSNTWNSLKKGLLAGETLKLALLRMHDAYLTKNKRRQEVERIISLKDLMNKKAAASFDTEIAKKEPAELKFNIDLESLGKKDVSSIVKIKSIAVSIPAVVGPYETFGAVLKHTHTKEEITISRGIEDMGVFIDEMNDGRYLPFEGLKIEKGNTEEEKQKNAWTLKFPETKETKDKNISDVILNIKFTVK